MASIAAQTRAAKTLDHIRSLFTSGKNADVTIQCDGRSWNLHKAILSSSTWFDRVCNGSFKEATTNVINIEDDTDYAVDAILRHLYSLPYAAWTMPSAVQHVHVYASAEKYGLNDLKSEVRPAFKAAINLHRRCWLYELPKLASLVDLVYTTTISNDRGLRDIMVDRWHDVEQTFLDEDTVEDKLRQIFHSIPDFAFDVWAASMRTKKTCQQMMKLVLCREGKPQTSRQL